MTTNQQKIKELLESRSRGFELMLFWQDKNSQESNISLIQFGVLNLTFNYFSLVGNLRKLKKNSKEKEDDP